MSLTADSKRYRAKKQTKLCYKNYSEGSTESLEENIKKKHTGEAGTYESE